MSVYVVGTLMPLACKVGYTTQDVSARLREICGGGAIIPLDVEPSRIRTFHVFDEYGIELEQWLHGKLKRHRIVGEWFGVSPLYVVRVALSYLDREPPSPATRVARGPRVRISVNDRVARTVPCPRCGVGIGRTCKTPKGHMMDTSHSARKYLAADPHCDRCHDAIPANSPDAIYGGDMGRTMFCSGHCRTMWQLED